MRPAWLFDFILVSPKSQVQIDVVTAAAMLDDPVGQLQDRENRIADIDLAPLAEAAADQHKTFGIVDVSVSFCRNPLFGSRNLADRLGALKRLRLPKFSPANKPFGKAFSE